MKTKILLHLWRPQRSRQCDIIEQTENSGFGLLHSTVSVVSKVNYPLLVGQSNT